MDKLNHPANAYGPANGGESDANKLVCSAEFARGCADPQKGAPPEIGPNAPIPEVKPRLEGAAPAEAVEAAPVQTHHAVEQPEEGFPEIACSAEFPTGCVNPTGESHP
jgi:hypothetical protein